MRGLHALAGPNGLEELYRWYAAQRVRRGRRHLFRVPAMRIDADRLRAPTWRQRRDPEPWRRHMERTPLRWPQNMRSDTFLEPVCGERPDVTVWVFDPHAQRPPAARRRGWCRTCWETWNDRAIQHAYATASDGQALNVLGNDWEEYVDGVERRLYVTSDNG